MRKTQQHIEDEGSYAHPPCENEPCFIISPTPKRSEVGDMINEVMELSYPDASVKIVMDAL